MKKILLLCAVLLAAVSCDNEWGSTSSWTKAFEDDMVTTGGVNTTPYKDPAVVTIVCNDVTQPVLNLSIEGARFVQGMPDVNFVLENLSFRLYDNGGDVNDPLTGAWMISYTSVVPKVGGIEREEYKMYNFRATITNKIVMEFDVDFGGARYHAEFAKEDLEEEEIPTWSVSHNLDVETAAEGVEPFDDEAVVKFLQADLETNKFDITVEGVQFVAQMPVSITFTLKGVAFTEIEHNEWGKVKKFEVDSIVPYVDGEPNEQYTFTNVSGMVSDTYVEMQMNYANFTILMTQSTVSAQ